MIDSLFFVASVIAVAIVVVWDIMHRHTPLHGRTYGLLQFRLTDEQRAELAEQEAKEGNKGRKSRRRRIV